MSFHTMARRSLSAKQDCPVKNQSFIHILRIKDFSKLILSNQVGYRHEFFRGKLSTGEQEYTLTLMLYPGGYDEDHKDYVAIRAFLDREVKYKIVVNIAVCDRGNEECFRRRLVLNKVNYSRVVVKDFVEKKVLANNSNYLRNNSLLKLSCRVFVNCEDRKSTHDSSSLRNAHLNNYETLFHNGDFSDFKLTVGEKIFKVHKCILATHSPVFAAMFRNDMSERSQASTDIQDIDAEVVRELLRFIYIGKVEKLDEMASDLWVAADKYDVQQLKVLCEEELIEKLSVETIVETLRLLDKFDMGKLKSATIEYIIGNAGKITSETKFKVDIRKLSSELLSDCLCAALKK